VQRQEPNSTLESWKREELWAIAKDTKKQHKAALHHLLETDEENRGNR
jgi:endonuclease I